MGYPDVQYNRSSRDTSTNTCLIRARARTQALPAVGSETCFGITSQDKKIVTVLGYQITRPSLRIINFKSLVLSGVKMGLPGHPGYLIQLGPGITRDDKLESDDRTPAEALGDSRRQPGPGSRSYQ